MFIAFNLKLIIPENYDQNLYFNISDYNRKAMETQRFPTAITVAYYPFRAKAQILRILCEYLHLSYQDRFLSPDDWNKIKQTEGKDWLIKDLPYLQHDDFVLTGSSAMISYVVQLAQSQDLLGNNIEDKMKVDSFQSKGCLNILLGFICSSRLTTHNSQAQKKQKLNTLFEKKIAHLMNRYQQECKEDDYFLGYLTIIDFFIYQIMNYFRLLLPHQLDRYPKLSEIQNRVASLPEIQNYEASPRVVQNYCPIRYFRKFREEKKRALRDIYNSDSTNNGSACEEDNKV